VTWSKLAHHIWSFLLRLKKVAISLDWDHRSTEGSSSVFKGTMACYLG
jgi:hypothetical protein